MTGPRLQSALGKTRIKICGIRSVETAKAAVEAGAEAIGLVIDVPDSPRCLTFEEAAQIAGSLPPVAMSVAVFCDPPPTRVERWSGSWIQLHGHEDESLVGCVARTKHVIKGFRFDPGQVLRWSDCPDVDVLLIDGSEGGRGEAFGHETLAEMMPQIHKPVILAGGLTPGNVKRAIKTVRPFAVDVSSGVESSPGVKDASLIRRFCESVAEAEK
ncbi:MAG: phosphoribosylanthranilate isomerase [Planctomycetota bacterium]|jgi:phosphoribosylanthranilate isomerase